MRVFVNLVGEWFKSGKIDQMPVLILSKNMVEWYQNKCKAMPTALDVNSLHDMNSHFSGADYCEYLHSLCCVLLSIELVGREFNSKRLL